MNNTSDVWLNIEEVCSLTNSKKETIRRKCKSGEYKCRFELAGRNKNYQILLSSMPLKYIEKYKSSDNNFNFPLLGSFILFLSLQKLKPCRSLRRISNKFSEKRIILRINKG